MSQKIQKLLKKSPCRTQKVIPYKFKWTEISKNTENHAFGDILSIISPKVIMLESCNLFYFHSETDETFYQKHIQSWACPWKTWLSPFFVFRIDLFQSAMENITNKPTNAIDIFFIPNRNMSILKEKKELPMSSTGRPIC